MIRERDLDQIVKRDLGPKQETINFRIVITDKSLYPEFNLSCKIGQADYAYQ